MTGFLDDSFGKLDATLKHYAMPLVAVSIGHWNGRIRHRSRDGKPVPRTVVPYLRPT
jgi:hypothetical protein